MTGAMAVGGALFVGLKQVKIAQRQADISARQIELQQFSLRSSLFDRRYKIYEATRIFLIKMMAADQNIDQLMAHELTQDFLGALNDSRILFDLKVHNALKEIWAKAVGFCTLITAMNHSYQTSDHFGDGNPARKADATMWFINQLDQLPELFEELNLGTLSGDTVK